MKKINIKLTERQLFYIWKSLPIFCMNGIMPVLFESFGGTDSKFYKEWAKEE